MSTLLYSPGVKAAIATNKGMFDITDDLVAGNLTLTENQPSEFRFQLANPRRKYDGVFTPNDRIVVQMRRMGPYLQVFSGYLDSVPYFSIYPRTVSMKATCTLKRLKFRLWDAGAQESWSLMKESFSGDNALVSDNSLKQKAVDLLTKVAEWPEAQIHIGALPPAWFLRVSDLFATLGDRIGFDAALVGATATIGGQPLAAGDGPASGGAEIPIPTSGTLTPQQVWDLIRSVGATEEEAIFLTAVAWPESRYKVDAVNPVGGKATGLWQIHPGGEQYKDPKVNAKTALGKLRSQGQKAWTARPGGPEAQAAEFFKAQQWAFKARDAEKARQNSPPPAATPVTTLGGGAVGTSGRGGTAIPPPAPPPVKDGAIITNGLRWTSSENLRPNVAAAKQFVSKNWPQIPRIGGFATSGHATNSDHYKGCALDLMVSSGHAVGAQRAMGNAMAKWFAENPGVFGIKYVIWYRKIIHSSGGGWRDFKSKPGASPEHTNHVHLSFHDSGQGGPGPSGSPLSGASQGPFDGGFSADAGIQVGGPGTMTGAEGAGGGPGLGGPPGSPLNVWNWQGAPDLESSTLAGARALMNDDPIMDSVATLMGTSMRSFMSAPNGDFIGWFPDYFGTYGTAAKMVIQDIELLDFTIVWDDERLVTHQYTAGSPHGTGGQDIQGASLSVQGGIVNSAQKYMTAGIVTVEFPDIMEALLNIKPGQGAFGDAQKILQRFGARKSYVPMGTITGRQAEFWYAVHLFQTNWAQQFSTNIPTTFMPELFPGMLIELPGHKLQAYVTQVTHSFSFTDGGGFATDATVVAPSNTGKGGGIYGLPNAL